MPYFPQLQSGATSQFPARRKIQKRTVRVESPEGREWKAADGLWRRVEWRLELGGLTSAEWGALEGLFHEVEGRRGAFTFLDPVGNLLAWSEEPEREAWRKDPYLEITGEVEDPWGTRRAARLRNAGSVPQKIEQGLAAPGWFQYCMSVWLRSEAAGEATVFARTGTAAKEETIRLDGVWRRIAIPVKLACEDEFIRFGLELGPGRAVEAFGMQVEAQGGASKYKKSGSRGGVYEEARFAEDILAVRAEGPECYACTVRVVARW